MLPIKINRDISSKEYDSGIIKGLNGREILYGAAAILLGGAIIIILMQYVPILLAVYIGSPICFLIGYMGFYNKHGMTFEQMMSKRLKSRKEPSVFTYSSKHICDEIHKIKNKKAME